MFSEHNISMLFAELTPEDRADDSQKLFGQRLKRDSIAMLKSKYTDAFGLLMMLESEKAPPAAPAAAAAAEVPVTLTRISKRAPLAPLGSDPDDETEDEVCEVCGVETWIEGNWLLLCDGENCRRAYHTQCVTPALSVVPEYDWLCPYCDPKIPTAPVVVEAAAGSLPVAATRQTPALVAAPQAATEDADDVQIVSREQVR